MTTTRRTFIRGTGLGVLSFTVGGSAMLLTPRDARAKGADLKVLSDSEAELLEAFGEALAPGASEAGIAHFVDSQLAADPRAALLMIKSFNVPPPYAGFYRGGLAALDTYAKKAHGAGFRELEATDVEAVMDAFVASLGGAQPDGWDGPPAVLFYLALRSDAVDVVYGTVEGFERLGVPYMPHIVPPKPW
ncbi:MAG: gluconate 2-dehydrogenase subunit 3 family protein [Gammaproteobacteria bacterium]